MARETIFKVQAQGDVQLLGNTGYMLVGGPDAVCFYVDSERRARVSSSTQSEAGCPVVFLTCEDDQGPSQVETEIEFPEFPGWQFHAGGAGKTLSLALVRREAVRGP